MGYRRLKKIKSNEANGNRHQPQQDSDDFYRCPICEDEAPKHLSPREYSHIEAGFSDRGFQVWCLRHERNIIHIDFMEQDVVADTGMFGKFGGRYSTSRGCLESFYKEKAGATYIPPRKKLKLAKMEES
jgi:hypothetical protein